MISINCIHKANKKASFTTKQLEDDEYVCQPKPVRIPKKIMKRMQMAEKGTRKRSPSSQSMESKFENEFEMRLRGNRIARQDDIRQSLDF